MSEETKSSFAHQVIGTLLFITLILVSLVLFLDFFSPKSFEDPVIPFTDYDRKTLDSELDPKKIKISYDNIRKMGSRSLGQKGFYELEKYIEKAYRDLGLEVLKQDLRSVQIVTDHARITDARGKDTNVSCYPFFPNHIQPMASPKGGIDGELISLTEDDLLKRKNFSDVIALIDLSKPVPKGLGTKWQDYAKYGIKAMIASHPKGLKQVNWTKTDSFANGFPINFVRLAADKNIFKHVGKRINIKVKTRFDNLPNRNIVGILKSPNKNREAIIIPVTYEGLSRLPDLNPGALQAFHVAIQLQLAKGLVSHKDQLKRDIIFIASGSRVMARYGQNILLQSIGSLPRRLEMKERILKEKSKHTELSKHMKAVRKYFDDPEFFKDTEHTMKTLAGMESSLRTIITEQSLYILNTLVFERSETKLQARLNFLRNEDQSVESPAFKKYLDAKKFYDKTFSVLTYPIEKLLNKIPEMEVKIPLRKRLVARIDELVMHHDEKLNFSQQEEKIHTTFSSYQNLIAVASEIVPSKKESIKSTLGFSMGKGIQHLDHANLFTNILRSSIVRLDLKDKVNLYFAGKRTDSQVSAKTRAMPLESYMWNRAQYPGYSIVNINREYNIFNSPVPPEWMHELRGISDSLNVISETILFLAYGNKEFLHPKKQRAIYNIKGNVYAANVGQSIIPTYPVKRALVSNPAEQAANVYYPHNRGMFNLLYVMTDPYGRYEINQCLTQFAESGWNFSPNASYYGENGNLKYIKDQGSKTQSLYKSMQLIHTQLNKDVNLVLFRCTPIAILDLSNPQSLKSFTSTEIVRKLGLQPLENFNVFKFGGALNFVKPDEYVYLKLKAGSADNDLVQTTRAFIHNNTTDELKNQEQIGTAYEKEFSGDGFLAADHPLILNPSEHIAKSMLLLNHRRLALQNEHHMADELTNNFQEKSDKLFKSSTDTNKTQHERSLLSRDATTYSILNHPVLRASIREAVLSIVWYMALLVPFVFFFEKLVFGFSDIRKQLLAQALIFITVFLLLRTLHPAFEMIRSSMMILLGFVIMLISLGITILFSGKFRENLDELTKKRGKVSAAEVNKLGVLGTSFMLGLNNMHRRKVRTGLTCATLVLLTFVMICFTSVNSELINSSDAIGKAPYQGFLVKDEKYKPVHTSLNALKDKYDHKYQVLVRELLFGRPKSWRDRQLVNPKIEIFCEHSENKILNTKAKSAAFFSIKDPVRDQIKFLTRQKTWFSPEHALEDNDESAILISDKMAEELQISPEKVDQEKVIVKLNGEAFVVQGIFDSSHFDKLKDIDGKNYRPFDITAIQTHSKLSNYVYLADDDAPQIESGEMVILLNDRPLNATIGYADRRTVSIVVKMPDDLPYKQAKGEIETYLEQSGRPTFFGLDGIVFRGRIARESTVDGLVDMLIPLIIAALTVLNTMKGSVYERKDEIYVYNAVGIAPRYIFFMFFAEALVYAVVGSVLGFLLSQGTGRILTELDFTGGLNMTFTSINTIYASLAIVAAVFISTYFPAKTAMEIATPAEEAGWKIPDAEGDVIEFILPFTFDTRERIAILEFFYRYFEDHGEGSSGPFYASTPTIGLAEELDELAEQSYIPEFNSTIWLKPFDLGVSQNFRIQLATDPDIKEFTAIIRLQRLSGTLESWSRLNKVFISLIRRHLLHWRAVTADEKENLFAEAEKHLRNRVLTKEELVHG